MFFRVSLTELRQAADDLGLESSWTLAAEAAQYRETLALEQAIKTDAELRQKWLEEQATFKFEDESLDEAEQVAVNHRAEGASAFGLPRNPNDIPPRDTTIGPLPDY